jgi:hypothetical protein
MILLCLQALYGQDRPVNKNALHVIPTYTLVSLFSMFSLPSPESDQMFLHGPLLIGAGLGYERAVGEHIALAAFFGVDFYTSGPIEPILLSVNLEGRWYFLGEGLKDFFAGATVGYGKFGIWDLISIESFSIMALGGHKFLLGNHFFLELKIAAGLGFGRWSFLELENTLPIMPALGADFNLGWAF